ncbi:FAD binding domain-containing protein [Streptomyces sp. TLI_185]|nr:FAD binding domain-containing protein [Streptomyces sp. TLI_185]
MRGEAEVLGGVLHIEECGAGLDLGVRMLPGKVGEVRQNADTVTAAGTTARWLIAADGLHSPVRRSLGLELPNRPHGRYGLRRHYHVEPWTDFVEVHWSRHGEADLTPVGDDLVGVAILSRNRRGYDEHLADFPALTASLRGPAATEVRGAGPLRQRVRRRTAGRVLLVGDAAGYLDALTGEGIALALATAGAAIRCLAADRPDDYERAWARLTRRHRLLTGALLTASRRPGTARLVVPAASRIPPLFSAAVHAGNSGPAPFHAENEQKQPCARSPRRQRWVTTPEDRVAPQGRFPLRAVSMAPTGHRQDAFHMRPGPGTGVAKMVARARVPSVLP